MINKIILDVDESLSPAIIKWDEKKEDYVIDIPNGITRADLIDLVCEVKRITEWAE